MENNSFRNKYAGVGALVVAVIILLGAVTFLTSLRKVETGEIGVVTKFGEVTGRELDEGISLVQPLGFNNVTEYDIKVQKEEAPTASATRDLQDVTAQVVLNYRLNAGKVSEIHQTVGANYKEKLIDPAIQEVFKSSSAKYNADELITQRAKLKADVYEQLRQRLNKYGIAVEDVSITNFSFSPSFSKAIESKQVAQQNAQRARFNLEAARVDAQAQEAQAETLSAEYLQLKAIEKWNGKLPDAVGGEGVLFNIPVGR